MHQLIPITSTAQGRGRVAPRHSGSLCRNAASAHGLSVRGLDVVAGGYRERRGPKLESLMVESLGALDLTLEMQPPEMQVAFSGKGPELASANRRMNPTMPCGWHQSQPVNKIFSNQFNSSATFSSTACGNVVVRRAHRISAASNFIGERHT